MSARNRPRTAASWYSNDWDVINYEGQEAYVSSRFLEKVEPVPETEVVPTGGDGAEGQ